MTAREQILGDIRTALGRGEGQLPGSLAPPLLRTSRRDRNLQTKVFVENLEKLSGKGILLPDAAAVAPAIQNILAGQTAVASNAPFLATCGVASLPNVRSGFTDREALREASSAAGIGITSADYALAETGSLVLLSSPGEARLVSLLPPVHIAVFPRSRILANLDELLSAVPLPAEQTSSMVLITGPSRTADIEQILVRGVHGPGEVYAVIVEDC